MRTAQLVQPVLAACLGAALATVPAQTLPTAGLEELWIEPNDLEERDLFRGPPLGPPPPDGKETFAFVKQDTSGKSPGYDVRDASGMVWSVKLGPEAQSEVVASRILWAIGSTSRQPATSAHGG